MISPRVVDPFLLTAGSRGDVYWVRLEPVTGSEPDKTRPAVIVSNDALNRTTERLRHGVVTVAPVTGSVHQVHTFQVCLPAGTAAGPTRCGPLV